MKMEKRTKKELVFRYKERKRNKKKNMIFESNTLKYSNIYIYIY